MFNTGCVVYDVARPLPWLRLRVNRGCHAREGENGAPVRSLCVGGRVSALGCGMRFGCGLVCNHFCLSSLYACLTLHDALKVFNRGGLEFLLGTGIMVMCWTA